MLPNHLTCLRSCEHRRTWLGDGCNPIPGKCGVTRVFRQLAVPCRIRGICPVCPAGAVARRGLRDAGPGTLGAPARHRRVRGHRSARGSAGRRHRGRRRARHRVLRRLLRHRDLAGGSRVAVRTAAGDPVIVRHRTVDAAAPARKHAERIWARVGRVTGTIVAADGLEFLVDTRRDDRAPQRVVIAAGLGAPDPGALPEAGTGLPARRHRHQARRPPARGGAGHRTAALPRRSLAKATPGRRPRSHANQRIRGLARARR